MVEENESAEGTGEPNVFDLFGDPPPQGQGPDTVPVIDPDAPVDLPHWTDPPTGQIPVLPNQEEGDSAWAELAGPQWHGEDSASAEGEDIRRVLGVGDDDLGVPSDHPSAGKGVGDPMVTPEPDPEPEPEPVRAAPAEPTHRRTRSDSADPRYRQARPRPRPERPQVDPAERNLSTAISVGAGLVALAGAAFYFGRLTTAVLVAAAAALCVAELTESMRHKGLNPAALVAIVAAGALPLGIYFRGVASMPLIFALMLVAGAVWFLVGAGPAHRPALDLSATFIGPLWVGVPATFAVLISEFDLGISTLVSVIAITAAFDTGAYGIGSAIGQTPFHPASPNKTWEGTLGGVAAGIAMALVLWVFNVGAFAASWSDSVLLGLVVSVLAMVGDLTESMVKRDLEVKDMSGLLPGHGGMFDRLDGLLFALPGAYYLALVSGLAVISG